MKQQRPVSVIALFALASCSTTISDPAEPPARTTGAAAAKLVGGGFSPGELTTTNDTLTRPLPDDLVTQGPASFDDDVARTAALGISCSDVCAATSGAAFAGCGTFSFTGVLMGAACGFASNRLCEAVCTSQRPTSRCEEHSGGKACMNTDRFWWCDGAVDGNKVRARYELEDLSEPGIVHTAWAPSRGCLAVRYPTAGWVKRWQVCVENEGCGEWIYPNHVNASASDYVPTGTPPSTEPPESADVTPPTVALGGTTPGQWYAGVVPIVANASDGESAISSITIYVNDEPIYSVGGGSASFSWDSSGYTGQIVVKAAATDTAGNTGWTWMYLDVSNRAPVATVFAPTTVSSQVWFECNTGGAGPITQTVLVDGTPINQGLWGWDSRTVADGPHTVTCRATDIMGRVTEQSTTTYVYNNANMMMWIYPHFQTFTSVTGNSVVEMTANIQESDLDFGEVYEEGRASSCSAAHDPNAHDALVLDCDGPGPINGGIDIAGRPDGAVKIWMHAHAKNDYQMTEGDNWYSRQFYVDNTPPLVTLDPVETKFVEVDGVRYLHLQATSPTPVHYWAPTPDSITNVEFFVRLPDGTTQSLGAVTSGYPWTLEVRVPDNAIVDSNVTAYAVATDTVFAHVDTPVHRTGTSADVTVTRTTSDGTH